MISKIKTWLIAVAGAFVLAIFVGVIGWGLWRYRDVLVRRLNSIQNIKVDV
ncbi:hypothetical protein [Maritalea sp.]|jgi:type VI protein secretion system component VasF|uniref:hypothetical protein n=1 Tax=Maritalea sp. TaxID=2003361 RepID=UPI0039E3BEE1